MPFGPSHPILRKVARWTMEGFFSDVHVEGAENVPRDGPLIISCTHWNMIVDPAVLSCWFPHGRMLHYWAKSTIFINAPVSALLKDAGNIPVDRKNKDNQKLFSGTFEVLKLGEVVAIFPEGTSYTKPHMEPIKEGISWAALEYEKNRMMVAQDDGTTKDVQLVVASIVYTKKTDYRSRAVVTFSKPIQMQKYRDEFLASSSKGESTRGEEEAQAHKAAVKALTAEVKQTMENMTINASDFDTLHAAETARQLLWGDDDSIPLAQWREVTQTLVDLFENNKAHSETAAETKAALVRYSETLKQLRFTNASLNALPLPRLLDPLHPAPVPDRLQSLWALFKASSSALLHLPFFILPLLAHMPAYVIGKMTQYYVSAVDEEEFAQNKIVFSLIVLVVFIYPAIFFFTWALCLFTPIGLVIALGWTAAFSAYHTRLVDSNYKQWKKLVAAWRVLGGLWTPVFLQSKYIPPVDGKASAQAAAADAGGSIRRMLRERSQAANAAADLLLKLERNEAWADRVNWLKQCGARIGYMGPIPETDRQGQLKQK